MLENAGIIANAEKQTNSDRYLAIKRTREFDSIAQKLDIKSDSLVTKNQVFEILVALMFLKPATQTNSEFTFTEN